jgi:trehalose 6-phosphate synthase/phosphatase
LREHAGFLAVLDLVSAPYEHAVGAGRVFLRVEPLSHRILSRLEAYEKVLERYPRWHRGVSLVQIVLPSPMESTLREHVERLVGRINGLFGEIDWVPVHYLYRSTAGSSRAGPG